jgi:hypothetical protein
LKPGPRIQVARELAKEGHYKDWKEQTGNGNGTYMRVRPETETESACLVLELGEGAEHKGEGGEEDNAQARPRKYLKAWNII